MNAVVSTSKIHWISVLQGWSMLLVVAGHVTLTNVFNDPSTPIASGLEKAIYRFHMPLFMFISGMLFYHTKIKKRIPYPAAVRNKAQRLLIPYICFSVFTVGLKLIFSSLVKRPVESSLQALIDIFFFPSQNPLGEMWFIYTLFMLFLLYPLYGWKIENDRKNLFLFAITLLICIGTPDSFAFLGFSLIGHFLFYFYTGILFFRYQAWLYLASRTAFVSLALFFLLSNLLPAVPVVSALTGILFSISLCLQLSRYTPRLFSSYRDYTFQIFLMGIFFQMAVRYVYTHAEAPCLYLLFYLISIGGGIYIPVAIARIIQRNKQPVIKRIFGLG